MHNSLMEIRRSCPSNVWLINRVIITLNKLQLELEFCQIGLKQNVCFSGDLCFACVCVDVCSCIKLHVYI